MNNVAACSYDGGDCCESTCGVTYDVDAECGTGGYSCLNPSASDYGTTDVATYDDDLFASSYYSSGG